MWSNSYNLRINYQRTDLRPIPVNSATQLQDYSGEAWNNRLLNAIVEIQAAHIEEIDIRHSFDRMLECLLNLTDSEYGFLGEVLHTKEGSPYLVTHALTDISWDEETSQLYEANMVKGFEFHNLNTLFGATLATSETVISNDPENDPRRGGLPHGHPGMSSYLGVPIKHRGEMLGMLGIANRAGGYEPEIVQALSPLLLTAGSIIYSMRSSMKNLEFEAELKEKNDLLNGVIHNITDALIITDFQGNILETNHATQDVFGYHAQELLGRHIGICLSDESKDSYTERLKQYLICGDRKVIKDRIEMSGRSKDGTFFPIDLAMNDIKLGNRKLFVNILQDISQRKSQERKIELANKKLQALSETDELTGIYNRRYFDKNFQKEFNRSRKNKYDLALALIDIDHFKAYNDTYGHVQGDQCLQTVGHILKTCFKRDCEFAARLGGEEFAVVMSQLSPEQCIEALQGLMAAIANEKIQHSHSVANYLTVSIGLAVCDPVFGSTRVAYEQADAALYKAKENGRNQLIVYNSELDGNNPADQGSSE